MEPRRIANYVLLEPIGHGGMAVVYRARQERLERIVAVKILSENLAASEEFMERFRREARTAANLRHPNVITVHDFGEDERGVPYLVLEYIEGPTLADLMDAGLDDARIPDLLEQIAAGLDYAHARGVIHRDVKPGNVLITEDGRAVLTDFGLAWLLEGAHLTLTGGVIGTPEYMSPEQATGEPLDRRCDVYALGVVLYEMLVGERPFSADTPIGVLLKHLQEPAPSILEARPELPAAVGEVLARVLSKTPAERYDSAGELARAFRAALTAAGPVSSALAAAVADSTAPADRDGQRAVGSSAASSAEMARAGAGPVATIAGDTLDPTNAAAADAPDGPASVAGEGFRLRCPGCGELMPEGAGICPACKYMIPLDQLPKTRSRPKLQRREVVVNLMPHGIRWTPEGLQRARRLAADALREATVDGWEPASIGEPIRLVQGRTIGGTIVERAILCLERLA